MKSVTKMVGAAIAAAVFGWATLSPALARAPEPFTQAAFDAAQQAGEPILIEIHANWCPTCTAQAPVLDFLTSERKFKDVKIFRVDFDAQKPIVRKLGANMQSTLIVFKGKTERGRSVGDTRPDALEGLLDKLL